MDLFDRHLEFNKIIFRDKYYYPQEINSAIDTLSSYLNTNKTSNSPFVYLFAGNHIKTIIAYFAIIKSGKICVLVDPDIKHIELGEMMQDTPPNATIKFDKMSEEFDYKNDIIFTDNNIGVGNKQLDDVCTMVYTNAEDGYSKAAMLTRGNLLSNAKAGVENDGINDKKACSSFLPLCHMYGLQTGVLTPLYGKATLLIEDIADFRKINKYANDINKHTITNFYTVPIVYYLLSKIPEIRAIVKNVKGFCSGGYKLSSSIQEIFQYKANKILYEGYGLTEASPVCTFYRPGESLKPNSVGRPIKCCQINILDDNNCEHPIGQIGEICVKGDNVMLGYYNKIKATNKVLKNGWLHTGDLGKIDKNGYIYITGLKKNMLKVGGKNVYPSEVRRLTKLCNNVKNIQIEYEESELLGNKLTALIELKKNTTKMQLSFNKWCHRNISNYKIPKSIVFH